MHSDTVLFDGETSLARYQVIDMTYEGRSARVLFTGNRTAAFSGVPADGNTEMLFDYNQRMLELTEHLQPDRILLIGGGVFTLPVQIIKLLPDTKIDAVEIDAGLLPIAEGFFDFEPTDNIQTFFKDGRDFIEHCNQRYNLILIDAFTGLDVPKDLTDSDAIQQLHTLLKPNGLLAYNLISAGVGRQSKPLKSLAKTQLQVFPEVNAHPADTGTSEWIPQNYIVVSQKEPATADYYQRYEAIKIPEA